MTQRALATLAAWALLAQMVSSCGSGGGDVPRAPVGPDRGWSQRGTASWYGPKFHGRRTASGEIFDMNRISAAHRTLPFGTVVVVQNLDNGRRLEVRINDRGPFIRGRIIDISRAAAQRLGMLEAGLARVRLTLGRGSAARARVRRAETAAPWVQLGAFRDRERARRLAGELRGELPDVAIYSAGGWHRVQLRTARSREEAEGWARRLRERGYAAALVEPH